MRTHTQDFKTKIKDYGRQFNDTIYYNNNTYDGERINSVNYSVDTSLMRSVMQTLKIDTDLPLTKGDTIDYGISLEGVTGSEIRFNNFIVDKVEDQKDKNSKLVTCYDNMIKTMVDYTPPGVTYPVTIRNYINAICTHLGITFKNASSTFTNYNKQIASEHYVDTDGNSLGYTFRDVLDDLAEATGSFICIDNTGKLEIRSVTNTNDTIDEEYFKDKNVTVGAKYGPINVVILSRGDDSDNLYRPSTLPVTKNEIKITDNPILDQDNREDFIDGIYNQLNGLEYYTNDFATNGILYYEVGDKFNVSIDNTTYQCLMLADNIKRTTGLSEKIYTKEPSTSVSDYKYASDTDKIEKTSRNAWIKANKAEGTAEMIVQGIGSQGQVTGASVIAAINGDQSNLSLNADKINLNGAVTANNNFKINTNGSVEMKDGSIDLVDSGTEQGAKIKVTNTNYNFLSTVFSGGFTVQTSTNNFVSSLDLNGFRSITRNTDGSDQEVQVYNSPGQDVTSTNCYIIASQNLNNSTEDSYGISISPKKTSYWNFTNNVTTTPFEVDGTTGNTTINGYIRPQSIVAKEGRLSTPNFDHQYPDNKASMRFDIASSNMNSSGYKPYHDGWLQTFFWDNSGRYDTQMLIPNNFDVTPKLQIRATDNSQGDTWQNDWKDIPILEGFDYGEWTPQYLNTTYSNYEWRKCMYIKLGKIVILVFHDRPTISSVTGNGNAIITNLPYAPIWPQTGGGGLGTCQIVDTHKVPTLAVNYDYAGIELCDRENDGATVVHWKSGGAAWIDGVFVYVCQ